jgi:hypothetical protein
LQDKSNIRLKKFLRKALKIIIWTLGSIVTLFLLLVIAFQIPAFQNFAKDQVVSYLEGKIHTKVIVNRIEIGLPKKVILEGFYFEDQKKDTLLSGEKMAIDISLYELFNNKVEINSIDLQNTTVILSRDNKSIYNFDYIIQAFASEDNDKKDDTPMEFSLDKVNFDKVAFRYKDAISNDDIAFKVNHFDTRIKTFDINKMEFEIPKAKINGLKIKLKQGIVETVEEIKDVVAEKTKNDYLKVKIGTVDLSMIDADFEDEKSKLISKIDLEKLLVTFNTINLEKAFLDIENLEVYNTKGSLELGKLDRQMIENDPTSITAAYDNWKVITNSIKFKNVAFKYDNYNYAPVVKTIDYNHFHLQNVNLDANELSATQNTSSGNINSLQLKDISGLNIQALKTNFKYTEKGAYLKNLYLKTPQTVLRKEIIVAYPSIDAIEKNPGEITIAANLSNSKLGVRDLLIVLPNLRNTIPFNKYPNAIISINSVISGKLKNLFLPKLEVSGFGATKLAASGRIIGLPDVNKAYFDLNIKNFQSGAKDIAQVVPRGTIPNSIQLPSQFTTKGTFKGTFNNFNTNLNLTSTLGNAKVKARFDNRIKNREKYDTQTQLDNFNLGKFIKNDSIGKVSLRANIKGVGLNPKTATATVDGSILKFGFHNYTYTNLDLNGKINNGLFDVKADTKDPNLTFNLVANGSFRDKYPAGKMKLNIDIADLDKLNLHAGPMKIRGEINADIQSADLDYLNGTVSASRFIIANEKDQFPIDSVTVIATSTAEKNTMVVKSQFVDVNIDGKYKLTKVADAVENSIANYYDRNSRLQKVKVEDQRFAYNVNVKDNRILLKFVPKLKSLDPITASGRYNSVNDTIIVNANIPKLIYDDNTITGGIIKVDTQNDALVYSIVAGDLKKGTFEMAYSSISGTIANNNIDYALQLRDLKNKDRYLVSGTLKSVNGNHEFHINPANLMLNYDMWTASNENLIRFGRNGIHVDDFELSQAGKYIRIHSLGSEVNAPINVDFIDFEIETITNIAQKSSWQMTGKINGTAVLRHFEKAIPVFTSDLVVSNFTFQKEVVGTVKINVNNETVNRYNARIELTDEGNQLTMNGYYNSIDDNLDMDLAITQLQVKSIQGFTYGNIKDGTGFWSGNLKVNGKVDQPVITGDLKFNQIGFVATKLNAQFKMMNDKITFGANTITFNNFIIKDERDNDLTINGKINSQDYANLGFDLRLDADNFKAVNSKERDNDQFYGELYLDNHLQIKGDWDNPLVEGNIKINKDTKFTFVLPQEDPSIADREGIVEFIDQDQPRLFPLVEGDQNLNQTKIRGINASVNIEIDKDAEISLIIDKATGDFLKLKGEAQLTGGIDPSGKTTLTGRYELTEGSYEMSFNLIKRRFDIKSGSYILWTGEPTMADISVVAVYKTETAPINLLNEQLSNLTAEERNTYKQRIPFETELKMKGDLMRPDITFDIILPEGNNSVSTEIIDATKVKLSQLRQDPDELNKQVFALLLLNRFIGENPFSSETGAISASSFARNSASKILSQQLNNLTANLIEGVELDFDLNSYEDYTTGEKNERTDLNVGLSKRLLDDRLKVSVGSSFGLEGEKLENQQTNNIAGDLAAEYQVSKDGRYKLRAYRKNKYQVALQGQVIETGVGFIITIDYNEFKEIFHRKRKEETKKQTNE